MATKECRTCSEHVKWTKVLICPKCSKDICMQCIINKIGSIGEDVNTLECMIEDCNHIWDVSFMIRSLPTVVLKYLKPKRQSILFQRERELLEDTFRYLSLTNEKKRTVNDIIVAKKIQDKDQLAILRGEMLELNKLIDHMRDHFDGKNLIETDLVELPVLDDVCVDTAVMLPYKKLESYEMNKETFKFLWYRYNVVLELKKNLVSSMDGYNLDLRLKYLNKRIDEEKWRIGLLKRDKDILFATELNKMKITYARVIGGALDLILKNNLTKEQLAKCILFITEKHHFLMDDYFKVIRIFQSKRRSMFLHPVELKKRYKPPVAV